MPITATAPALGPMVTVAPSMPVYRLSVAQYEAMVRAGILPEDNSIELLDGLLVPKMPKNPPHRIATRKTRRVLEALLPATHYADSQEPVVLSTSVPEPDIAVVRGELADDASRNPEAADVALVVEVAEATLSLDRGAKKALYGAASIPTYWIVNIVDRRLEVFTNPTGPCAQPGYAATQILGPNDEVPVVIDGQEVARILVRELLS